MLNVAGTMLGSSAVACTLYGLAAALQLAGLPTGSAPAAPVACVPAVPALPMLPAPALPEVPEAAPGMPAAP
jgi:hypothetical protein